MTAWLVIAAVLAWWGWGFAGFVYWWTTSWTMKAKDVPIGLLVGLVLGPLAWLVGRWVHRDNRRPPYPPVPYRS